MGAVGPPLGAPPVGGAVDTLLVGPPGPGVELELGMLVVALDDMDCGVVTGDVVMAELLMLATEIK